MYLELFGEDSDDEGMKSPVDVTPEFVASCKKRIGPLTVKLLMPYYRTGRIRGRALFKALAKHLTKLIYEYAPYPSTYFLNHYFFLSFMVVSKV